MLLPGQPGNVYTIYVYKKGVMDMLKFLSRLFYVQVSKKIYVKRYSRFIQSIRKWNQI